MAPSVVLGGILVVFLALPLVGLPSAPLSAAVIDAMRRPIVVEAVRLSFLTTVLVLVPTLIFRRRQPRPRAQALPRHQRGRPLVDLPIVAAGRRRLALPTFGRRGMLGPTLTSFGIELPFTTAAVVVASMRRSRAARSGFWRSRVRSRTPRGSKAPTSGRCSARDGAHRVARLVRRGHPLLGARPRRVRGDDHVCGPVSVAHQTMPLAIYAALGATWTPPSVFGAAAVISFVLLLFSAAGCATADGA
jgi:hypothetical protein